MVVARDLEVSSVFGLDVKLVGDTRVEVCPACTVVLEAVDLSLLARDRRYPKRTRLASVESLESQFQNLESPSKPVAVVQDPVVRSSPPGSPIPSLVPDAQLSILPVVQPVQPSLPFTALELPDIRSVKLRGPDPISSSQMIAASGLVGSSGGLFGQVNSLVSDHPLLAPLRDGLARSLVQSRAPSTFSKYWPLVKAWSDFALSMGQLDFPAARALLLLYLQQVKEVARVKGNKAGRVVQSVYAIDFAHACRGLDRPGADPAVKMLVSAALRELSRPVVKKAAASKSLVIALVSFWIPDPVCLDLDTVRPALFVLLAFVLEARFDDVIHLSPSCFFDYQEYMVAFVHRKEEN